MAKKGLSTRKTPRKNSAMLASTPDGGNRAHCFLRVSGTWLVFHDMAVCAASAYGEFVGSSPKG